MENYKHKVKIEKDKYVGLLLTNTHNGNQRSSLSVYNIKELEEIRDAINEFLADLLEPPVKED